ncbi:MAG TPA: IS256 family transposase, partial [Terriglobales bacterium]
SLGRCLVSTNVIESPHSGVRLRTRRVCRWRDGKMVLRWAAAALLMTEKNFRRIMGYQDLWMLKAALGRTIEESSKEKAA